MDKEEKAKAPELGQDSPHLEDAIIPTNQENLEPQLIIYPDVPTKVEAKEAVSKSVSTTEEVEALNTIQEEEDYPLIPSIITAKALAAINTAPKRFLLEPFLPVTGTALIAGKPDTGKSQFARQLAIEVSQGAESFIGFRLDLRHKRAIYVATEDDATNCNFLQEKQHTGLGYLPNDNLCFVFADNMNQETLLSSLGTILQSYPADLIIVDSFSDVFQGNDMNSNTQMRQTVRKFDNLSKKHKCLILFVHHINKGAYDKAPSQQSIQGGSGLAQKVRLAWQMSSREGTNLKSLAVTKGNYTPREYKESPLALSFDETTFTFTKISEDSSITASVESPKDKHEKKISRLFPDIKAALYKASGMSYSLLLSFLMTDKLLPEATAKRRITWLKEKKYLHLDEEQKLYFWNEQSPVEPAGFEVGIDIYNSVGEESSDEEE